MDIFFTIVGLVGTLFVVSMYFMLEQEKISPTSLKYYFINGLGGFFILISIAIDFDMTDLGGITIEFAWVIISVMGIIKVLRKEKRA